MGHLAGMFFVEPSAEKISEIVTFVNTAHHDCHPFSCHPAWYTINVMTHKFISNRKNTEALFVRYESQCGRYELVMHTNMVGMAILEIC